MHRSPRRSLVASLLLLAPLPQIGGRPPLHEVEPPVRVMAVGDSITQGYASWRYPLWFTLPQSPKFEFVGQRNSVFPDDVIGSPNPKVYPFYHTTFDRDHQAIWGARTDGMQRLMYRAALEQRPDIVLVHLGTNDVGTLGALGLMNARIHLARLIEQVRAACPATTFLVAQIIPIGRGNALSGGEELVPLLNEVIAQVVEQEDTPASPVVLVDQYTGFDVQTDLQPGGLHPSIAGENRMAQVWRASLLAHRDRPLPPRRPEPAVLDASFTWLVPVEPGPEALTTPWRFGATAGTFYGLWNPEGDSYLGAEQGGVPPGAEGPSVAFLYDAGPEDEAVVMYQTLATTCEPDVIYELVVAIGNRLPTNPFGPSTFGGFKIELLAGNQVIGSLTDGFVPPPGKFEDALLSVPTRGLSASVIGEALTVRLSLTVAGQGVATDFDDVRLTSYAIEAKVR